MKLADVILVWFVGTCAGAIGMMAYQSIAPQAPSSKPDAALGYSEIKCIEGYKFILGYRGSPTQIMDSQGHGIPCL